MPKLGNKAGILDREGYRYNFDRMMYINRESKKAFSIEFIEDHPENELTQRIREANEAQEWKFYFNSPPSDGVKHELERTLG